MGNYLSDCDENCLCHIPVSRLLKCSMYICLMQVVGFSDTDIAEYIYARRPQVDSLVNYLCKDLTKSCSKNPPAVPKVTSSYTWNKK